MNPDERSDRDGQRFADRAALESRLAAAGRQSEAAALDDERRLLDAAARDDVDGAAKGVGAEERRARSVQDLDALHRVERHRDVAVVMARLRVVQPDAVDEHEHLAEVRAAHREIGLHAANAARPHVHRRRQAQHVGDVCTGSAPICSRVMTVIVRVTLPSSTGRAAAVTTTVCR